MKSNEHRHLMKHTLNQTLPMTDTILHCRSVCPEKSEKQTETNIAFLSQKESHIASREKEPYLYIHWYLTCVIRRLSPQVLAAIQSAEIVNTTGFWTNKPQTEWHGSAEFPLWFWGQLLFMAYKLLARYLYTHTDVTEPNLVPGRLLETERIAWETQLIRRG